MNSISKEIFVSVAMTTFNGESFLREQLDSLLGQSYENFEIIISDDGSKDGTHEILNEYQTKDSRIKWVLNPNPNGFIKNFEYVIGLCRGEIIFLCDQDDIWYSEKISKHVDIYKSNKDIHWVYNRVILIDDEDKEIGFLEDSAPDYYKKRKLLYSTWGSCVLGCATSYRSKLLKSVLPIGKYAPAHDSWIQLAIFPKKSFYINEVLQSYRQHCKNVVGWGKEIDTNVLKEREKQAISDNLRYLKCLSTNRNLTLGKRLFFLVVYFVKLIRNILTSYK